MSVTLKLTTDQSLYFLAPEQARSSSLSGACPENGPDEQICVGGLLTLRVRGRPRRLRHLSVTFCSDLTVLFPAAERHRSRLLYSKTHILHNTTSEQVYPVGEHHFAFSFFLPHDTPPSDEAINISLRHRLRAKAIVGGRFNDRLQATVLPVRLIASDNAAVSEMPEALVCTVESYSDFLGPYRCDLYADALTVGSLLRVKLSFGGGVPVSILSVRGQVEERVEVGQEKDKLKLKKVPHRFCTLDSGKKELLQAYAQHHHHHHHQTDPPVIDSTSSPGKPTKADEAVLSVMDGKVASLVFLTRLPNCRTIRASTVDGSNTPLRVSHALNLDVRYRAIDGTARVMSIYKKVHIASCTCITDSISLPPYEEHARTAPQGNNSLCACGLPLDKLVSASHFDYDSGDEGSSSSASSSSPPVTPLSDDDQMTFPSSVKSESWTLSPQVVHNVIPGSS